MRLRPAATEMAQLLGLAADAKPLNVYALAVEDAFGGDVDDSTLVKEMAGPLIVSAHVPAPFHDDVHVLVGSVARHELSDDRHGDFEPVMR